MTNEPVRTRFYCCFYASCRHVSFFDLDSKTVSLSQKKLYLFKHVYTFTSARKLMSCHPNQRLGTAGPDDAML